jgi:predicted alpha/beta-fold hydrolase
MVVHGLYDSKRTRYVEITAAALADAGFGVLAPDMRWHGCLLAKSWLPTLGVEEGADLAAWARWLHARQPDHAVGVVGFSLGALDALHAVGGRDGEVFDAGVIAVSPPAALGRTLERFDTRAYWRDRGALVLIDRFFRRTLERRMRDLGLDPGAQPFAELLAWRAAQAPPRFGLTPARLIELADPVPKIAAARRPLLLISDRIDPVFSGASVAELARAAAGNRWAHLVETPYGGHIGHPGTYPQWFAEVLVRFFSAAPEVAAADAVAGE